MFFKRKKRAIDMENLPKHLAFICDGNRRWARHRGLPTLLGHKEGVEAIKRVVRRASELGIENLTFFCFSTENFDSYNIKGQVQWIVSKLTTSI